MKFDRILFVCVGNSCRSQMAEGLLRNTLSKTLGVTIDVRSAGVIPSKLDGNAVKVLREMGVDISNQKPKHIQTYRGVRFDLIIVLDRMKELYFESYDLDAPLLVWPVPDPHTREDLEGAALDSYRRTAEQLMEIVRWISSGVDLPLLKASSRKGALRRLKKNSGQ